MSIIFTIKREGSSKRPSEQIDKENSVNEMERFTPKAKRSTSGRHAKKYQPLRRSVKEEAGKRPHAHSQDETGY